MLGEGVPLKRTLNKSLTSQDLLLLCADPGSVKVRCQGSTDWLSPALRTLQQGKKLECGVEEPPSLSMAAGLGVRLVTACTISVAHIPPYSQRDAPLVVAYVETCCPRLSGSVHHIISFLKEIHLTRLQPAP